IIATPLDTVPTDRLLAYLQNYASKESVDEFVIGMPKTLKNEDSAIAPHVRKFIQVLRAAFPATAIHEVDERFTSTMAQRAMIEGGMKKKDRQVKGNADKISATIILQSFLDAVKR
ncbi:MAG TPA: Holliday junction resolvase RuvX, partial [Chryseosolibacter sp.]|nr:Holliday junction resolvase RuvX [Chryseosolibacter sp.]